MTRFRAQLTSALEAVTIGPSGSCTWYGRRISRPPAQALPVPVARAYVVAVLEHVLYESFYCSGAPIPPAPDCGRATLLPDPDFVEELSAANAGRGCWAAGWRVDARSGHDLLLQRDGIRVRVKPNQAQTRGAVDAAIGAAAEVRLPKELAFASPGFYTAVSDTDVGVGSHARMLRLYFHVVHSGAVGLMAGVTSSLNAMAIPFRLKVVNAPERFSRCDAAVLYVRATDFDDLRAILVGLVSSADIRLRAPTPAFTKPLTPGLGLAEHPASGESFGTHRCRLLAEGIVEAHLLGIRRPAERIRVVETHLTSSGVNLEAPYLEPGSVDRYVL